MMAGLPPIDPSLPGRRIAVYDRLPPPPRPDSPAYRTDVSRYYLLGLGHRGQSALRSLGVWDDVERASVAVVGRRDWQPGKTREEDGRIAMANKKVTSRVLARDKLVGVLKRVAEERYGDVVDLRYGYQVDPVDFGDSATDADEGHVSGNGPPVRLEVSRCSPLRPASGDDADPVEECSVDAADGGDGGGPRTVTANLLIGADGAARTIANAMEARDRGRRSGRLSRLLGRGRFRVTRFDDDNPRVYKSVPIKFPSHWPGNLNYSARSTGGRITLEALPSDTSGTYCALLLMKPDDPLSRASCPPSELRSFFDGEFPQFSSLIDDGVMSDVAGKAASTLPSFRYAGPRLHEGRRTVLLGDCAHTVKPYFGLGANTALQDVERLGTILGGAGDLSANLGGALERFTDEVAADSRALVTLSRSMDRPGRMGTVQFVLPLILDSAFHRVAPWLFGPNMFGMFRKDMGYRAIQRRKRLDRAMQATVLAGASALVWGGTRRAVRALAGATGAGEPAVAACLAASLCGLGLVRRGLKAATGGSE